MYLQSFAHYDRDRALRDRDRDLERGRRDDQGIIDNVVKVRPGLSQSESCCCLMHGCTPASSASEETNFNRLPSATAKPSTSTRCRPSSRCEVPCLGNIVFSARQTTTVGTT